MHFILQWIDIIWLPLAWLLAAKQHRLIAAGYVLLCMIMMRMMAELMESAGLSDGMTGHWHMPVFERGLAVYSFFYACYLTFAHFQPRRDQWLFMAASFGFFIAAGGVYLVAMLI